MSTLAALTLIGLALFIGGILLRRLPAAGLAIGAVIVGFGLGIPAIVIDENRKAEEGGGGGAAAAAPSGGESTAGGTETTPAGGESKGGKAKTGGAAAGGADLAEGKQLFTQSCGTCHSLADAGTAGQVGPPLDPLKPDEKRVLSAIEKGGTGSGTMPANLLTGKDADAVSKYVSSVAGK